MALIWSSEKYKASTPEEKQAMEVKFENWIRSQVGGKYVIMSQTYTGISNVRNYKRTELSFNNIFRHEGFFDLHTDESREVFAVHRHHGPFLGMEIGTPIRFHGGDGLTVEEFMTLDF